MVRSVDGRGFAFVPRDLVAQPKAFGLAPGLLVPAHGVDESSERYRAAMVQHLLAVAVRAEVVKAEGVGPAVYVSRFEGRGLGVDRTRRVLRGETMAQLTDVMFWISRFPVIALAIGEHAAEWFGVVVPATNGEFPVPAVPDEVVPAAPATSSAPSGEESEKPSAPRQRSISALRKELEARRDALTTPGVRRSPQNPYVSPSRRI